MARIAIVKMCVAAVVCAIHLALAPPQAACAEDGLEEEDTSWHEKTDVAPEPSLENWIGGDGFRRVASLYSGITWSPFGNLRQDGFRLRAITGQSVYRYSGNDFDPTTGNSVTSQFAGSGRFVDLLAGWQISTGNTTVKAFAGAALQSHIVAPYDPSTRIQGQARGAKGVVEIWHNWTSQAWSSLDLSMTTSYATMTAQLRSGWRITETVLSMGPEAAITSYADVNDTTRTRTSIARVGLFVRYEDLVQEITISGGISRAMTQQASGLTSDPPMGYGTLQYLRRF